LQPAVVSLHQFLTTMPDKVETTATLSDGTLDVHVSREKTKGELTMNDFIKKHMAEILRPFAERVDDLQKAVSTLGEDLLDNNEKTDDAHKQLAFHMKLLTELRSDLDRTTERAKLTQAGLEKTNAEKAILEADHRETKAKLERVNNRLTDTVAHLEKLQVDHNATADALGQTEQNLVKTNHHITKQLEPVLQRHGDEIGSLEQNQQSTAQLLGETKLFGERAHQEFLAHVDERAKLNKKDQETFVSINEQMAHMSTMLTENINRLNTHANHLKTTNALIRPLKSQVEELMNGTHVLQLQQRDNSTHIEHLQALGDQHEATLNQLRDKFGRGDKGAGLYSVLEDLQAKVQKQQATLMDVEETVRGHTESRASNTKRIEQLERSTGVLQQQTKTLQDQVGVDAPAPSMQMPMPMPMPQPVAKDVAQPLIPSPDPAAGKNMAALMKFQSAVNAMSIKERQREFKKRMDNHDEDLALHTKKLQEHKHELDIKGQRVTMLEQNVANTNKLVDELKAGLELTEEYWKGLSGGFRDTHKSVNVTNELLPPKANFTLPSLQSPRSARGSVR